MVIGFALWLGCAWVLINLEPAHNVNITHATSILGMAFIFGCYGNWMMEAEAREGYKLSHSLRNQMQEGDKARRDLSDEMVEHRATLEDLVQARRHAERASEAKSDFVAAVSHELRTPLNGMVGSIQLLSDTDLDDNQREYQQVLSSSAQSLSLLIDDLFDLTRIEAGLMRIEPVPTNLPPLLKQLEETLSNKAGQTRVALQFNISENLPNWVLVDPHRLRQVLTNLLENALKFTQNGVVELTVGHADEELTFCVKDTGIGLPDNPDVLFQKYHQEVSKESGLGLGLSICHLLVQFMGGSIKAANRPHGGAEFTVRIPLHLAAQPMPETDTSNRSRNLPQGTRILVVEDNPINQKVVRWSLEQLGCRVTVADDGLNAIQTLNEGPFDMVLMDCEMPGLDGYQTTGRIRLKEDAMQRVPIIAVTAHATQGARERCLAAGMDDYLPKPIRRQDLERVLVRWVSN